MKIKKSEESCVGVMSDEIGSLTYADPGQNLIDTTLIRIATFKSILTEY